MSEIRPYVLVSSIKDDPKQEDLLRIADDVKQIINDWQSKGKIIWSAPFTNHKTSMAVFEGTDTEAKELYDQYDKICSGTLEYFMYEWEAMPILSVLSKN